jgi:hypothetical protein
MVVTASIMIIRVSIFFLTVYLGSIGTLGAQETEGGGPGVDPTPFARLLAKAAMDSSLLDNRRIDVGSLAVKNKTGVMERDDRSTMPTVTSNGGWKALYLIREGEGVDTVEVYIPSSVPDSIVDATEIRPLRDTNVQETLNAPTCAAELAEADFLNLRGRMAAVSTERGMNVLVERMVREKCFSLSQVRRLCNIFLYDLNRVVFFETVYGHVVDPQDFSQLRSFLSDPASLKRFDLLIGR